MDGMARDGGERVVISYTQGMSHDNLEVTLSDGEHFKGKVVMVGASTGFTNSFGSGTAFDTLGNSAYASGSAFGVVSTYTGSMQGVLFGNKSNTMVCSLQYADSSGFTSFGGVGICETSYGKVIDIQW